MHIYLGMFIWSVLMLDVGYLMGYISGPAKK